MKTTCKVRRKKVFPALLILLVLAVVLSVGTTLGKYHYEFPTSDTDLDEGYVEIDMEILYLDPTPGEGPGIVEETPTTVYQVQPGDTLSSIAEKFHTTVEALAAYNNIADPDKIQAGMILRIPPADYVVPSANTENTEKAPSTEPAEGTAPAESEPTSESNPGTATGEATLPPESEPSVSVTSSEGPSKK